MFSMDILDVKVRRKIGNVGSSQGPSYSSLEVIHIVLVKFAQEIFSTVSNVTMTGRKFGSAMMNPDPGVPVS